MTTSYTTLFCYSKYSEASKEAAILIKTVPELAESIFICIDNKQVREHVTNRDQYMRISYFPCIIRIYNDTFHSEIFEGEKVYELIDSYKKGERKKITITKDTMEPIETTKTKKDDLTINVPSYEMGPDTLGERERTLGERSSSIFGTESRLDSYAHLEDNTIREPPSNTTVNMAGKVNIKLIEQQMLRERNESDTVLYPKAFTGMK